MNWVREYESVYDFRGSNDLQGNRPFEAVFCLAQLLTESFPQAVFYELFTVLFLPFRLCCFSAL
jgi:hypothetical protein